MIRVRRFVPPHLALLALTSGLGCTDHNFAVCDITQRACQEDIYYRMLKLRGDGYDPFGGLPPMTVISEDTYRQQLEQEAATAAQSGPNPWDEALVLLHFTSAASSPVDAGVGVDGGTGVDAGASNSTIEDQVAHVYAFYDSKTKTVTVIDHPNQNDSHVREDAMITLAHELVHALQDREFNLEKGDFNTSDEYFAWDAIIEGDARFYELMFTKDLCPLISGCTGVMTPEEQLQAYWSNFDQLGSPLFAARALIYPLGATYLDRAYRSGGNAAVRHAYAKAPIRTVGFLVGDDGRIPPVGTGDVCPAPVALSLAPTDKTSGADQFGALLLYTFLRGWNIDHDVAFATAQTWTGDFLRVQASSDFATSAAAWRIELSATPPTSIVQALTATGELAVTPSTNALTITVSTAATPLAWTSPSSCP
jgi:hypothetical protein